MAAEGLPRTAAVQQRASRSSRRRSRGTDIKFPWVDDTELNQAATDILGGEGAKTVSALFLCATDCAGSSRLGGKCRLFAVPLSRGVSSWRGEDERASWRGRIALGASTSPGNGAP